MFPNKKYNADENVPTRLKTNHENESNKACSDIPHVSSTTSPTKIESDHLQLSNDHARVQEYWGSENMRGYQTNHYVSSQSPESNSKARESHSKKRLQVS